MPIIRLRRHALQVVKIAVSAGILAFLAYRVDVGRVLGALAGLRPGLAVAALALYIVGQLISAGKWKLVGTALGFRQRYTTYVAFVSNGKPQSPPPAPVSTRMLVVATPRYDSSTVKSTCRLPGLPVDGCRYVTIDSTRPRNTADVFQ